jgi:membrane-bound serine protease (ClpP class)
MFALALGLVRPSAHADERHAPPAHLLSLRGGIDPVTARYLEREIKRAEADGAELVIVQLDTPGGLESSMREIVQTLLASRVPLVVYVAPPGARAASAGMFVTIAAGVAAMSPGTEIGAAHPVRLGGDKTDSTMEAKVVHDAAAFARTIAETRHRNSAWPERAVRESVSLTSAEALREGVIDLVAADVPDLLRQLDGRSVPTASGDRIVHTGDLVVDERPMHAVERIVRVVGDPNLAYLLFLVGLLGITAELYHPGTFVPGSIGTISLVLALVGFGNLPISWAGVVLILLALGLFVGEVHTGAGALAVLGLVAFVVGSLLLYGPSEPTSPWPAVRVSPVMIAVMSAAVAAFFLLVVRATLRARHLAVRTGLPVLVGHVGIATSELAPAGTVRVDSEVWSAESEGETIHAGERVKVVGAAGVTLRVTRSEEGEASWNHPSLTSP